MPTGFDEMDAELIRSISQQAGDWNSAANEIHPAKLFPHFLPPTSYLLPHLLSLLIWIAIIPFITIGMQTMPGLPGSLDETFALCFLDGCVMIAKVLRAKLPVKMTVQPEKGSKQTAKAFNRCVSMHFIGTHPVLGVICAAGRTRTNISNSGSLFFAETQLFLLG